MTNEATTGLSDDEHFRRKESRPFPVSHEDMILASKREGELKLAEIAGYSDREHLWTFDDEGQVWRYITAEHYEIANDDGSAALRLEIPFTLYPPLGPKMAAYHIHPRSFLDRLQNPVAKRAFEAAIQLPSEVDIQACVDLGHMGYPESNFVTTQGVTTLRYNKYAFNPDGPRISDIFDYKYTNKYVASLITAHGARGAVENAVHEMNSGLGDLITISVEYFEE